MNMIQKIMMKKTINQLVNLNIDNNNDFHTIFHEIYFYGNNKKENYNEKRIIDKPEQLHTKFILKQNIFMVPTEFFNFYGDIFLVNIFKKMLAILQLQIYLDIIQLFVIKINLVHWMIFMIISRQYIFSILNLILLLNLKEKELLIEEDVIFILYSY